MDFLRRSTVKKISANVAWFRVVDLEGFVGAVSICFVFQIAVERENVVHQVMLEILHILFLSLAADELLPRREEIFDGDDILVGMSENNSSRPTPPARLLPVIEHATAVYKLWYGYRNDFPKGARYTLGARIDATFVYILECLFVASYQGKNEKLPTIIAALRKTDLLKFFLRIAWELQALNTKKYALLSEKTDELGRMVGGWKKGLEMKTPAR